MNENERQLCLDQMRSACAQFYSAAIRIGNHPWIEFTGLMSEYIKACELAHRAGIDFSQCSTHSGADLPLQPFQVAYINEKLECIFTGRMVMSDVRPGSDAGATHG